MARSIRVPIIGDASQYKRALADAQTKTSKFGAVAKTALVSGAAAGFYALGKAAKIGWDEFNAGQRVAAQTNAVIKSTGAVANVTAQDVEDLGHALMLKSGIDDEVIKSGENVLLTFRGIRNEVGKGNDIFDQATKLTLDLSVAMGRDMNSSAVMVGKALQDPIRGLTALRRVGVQFTSAQEDQIVKLTEAGKTMQAQKMILAELRKEFGGSAKAAGETFGGQLNILRERMNNFLGDVTAKAIPYLQRLMKWLGPRMHDALVTARKAWSDLGAVLARHRETIAQVQKALSVLVKVLGVLVKWEILLYSTIFNVWMKILGITLTVTDKIIGAVQKMIGFFRSLGGAARAVGNAVATGFRIMIAPILAVINTVQRLIDLIRSIPSPGDIVGGVTGKVGDIAGHIPGFASGGVVPGRMGAPRLIMAHGGETVLPTHRGVARAGSVNVIVLGGDREAIEYLRQLDIRQSRRSGRGLL